jgi:hypothetical protein
MGVRRPCGTPTQTTTRWSLAARVIMAWGATQSDGADPRPVDSGARGFGRRRREARRGGGGVVRRRGSGSEDAGAREGQPRRMGREGRELVKGVADAPLQPAGSGPRAVAGEGVAAAAIRVGCADLEKVV